MTELFTAKDFINQDGESASAEAAARIANEKVRGFRQVVEQRLAYAKTAAGIIDNMCIEKSELRELLRESEKEKASTEKGLIEAKEHIETMRLIYEWELRYLYENSAKKEHE